jgi:hypothetical protein
MNTTNDRRRIAEALFIMVIATVLFFGPCLGPGENTDGVSFAGPRDGGGKSAPRASKVDRQPRGERIEWLDPTGQQTGLSAHAQQSDPTAGQR